MPSIKSIASGVKKAASGKNPFESGLKKLTIQAFDNAKCSEPKKGKDTKDLIYTVQFNPTAIDESASIEFTDVLASGAIDGEKKFKHVNSTDLSVKLTIDGTGVAESGSIGLGSMFDTGEKDTYVTNNIDTFKKVCCEYDGETHEIPYVNVLWGKLDFKGRLKDLKINYLMFNSQGKPLRATLTAIFTSATDLKTQVKQQANASPDLTHTRTVKVGDTLPLMCQGIYKDSSYYLKVAKFNNIIDFRNLEPGTEIIFPPII